MFETKKQLFVKVLLLKMFEVFSQFLLGFVG